MPGTSSTSTEIVELRPAVEEDTPGLRRLAGRDTRALPRGPLMVAVRGGRIEAALSLATLEAVADPFRPTAELVDLLRVRAGAMSGRPGSSRRPAIPRLRPRAVPA